MKSLYCYDITTFWDIRLSGVSGFSEGYLRVYSRLLRHPTPTPLPPDGLSSCEKTWMSCSLPLKNTSCISFCDLGAFTMIKTSSSSAVFSTSPGASIIISNPLHPSYSYFSECFRISYCVPAHTTPRHRVTWGIIFHPNRPRFHVNTLRKILIKFTSAIKPKTSEMYFEGIDRFLFEEPRLAIRVLLRGHGEPHSACNLEWHRSSPYSSMSTYKQSA